uniref:Rege-1 UBA-like domain-containing protein n=1 Tax=Poecilia reticulata TaxID=8081 RepID=A0A3P9NY58_POERE
MTSDPQLDFFHKLGFSTAQVRAVQRKFGADTDKVLGELVRVGAGPRTAVSVLVPRGDAEAPGPELLVPVPDPLTRNQNRDVEDRDALRAVVIDGSNVAMRDGNLNSAQPLHAGSDTPRLLLLYANLMCLFGARQEPAWRQEPARRPPQKARPSGPSGPSGRFPATGWQEETILLKRLFISPGSETRRSCFKHPNHLKADH